MRSTDFARPVWHYTLQLNYWLNRMRPLEMLTYQRRRREACIIYDYTIWCGSTVVAAWSGTESDAFGAMLHLAAHADRDAALLAYDVTVVPCRVSTAGRRLNRSRQGKSRLG